MKERMKSLLLCISFFTTQILLGLALFLLTPKDYSISERRPLSSMPSLTLASILDGTFMTDFESFSQDQFPGRESLRTCKAIANYLFFQKKENHGIYYANGFLSKMDYSLKPEFICHSADQIDKIYQSYLKDTDCQLYMTIIPDKNYYLAEVNGYPAIDYDALDTYMQNRLPYLKMIDIKDTLSIDDYYYTDTHWKQENLASTASRICEKLQVSPLSQAQMHTIQTLDTPFYGVYYGQSALPVQPDTIRYVDTDILKACSVTSYNTGIPKQAYLYNHEKAHGKDPYEFFLSGNDALIVIDNPLANTERELILFRDSFASSLTPLILKDYSKITLVDIRYLNVDYIGQFIDFTDQDVYFLYSTLVLNSSAL